MKAIWRAALLFLAMTALAACATTGVVPAAYPEATPFDSAADAPAELELALSAAAAQGKAGEGTPFHVLAVFGANWCHDSRALAGWLETPRFRALTNQHYKVVYIDVGVPQTGEGRNLELAEGLGVSDITGTPTMLVIDDAGQLLNTPEDAKSWRNASLRSRDDILAWLESWTAQFD